MRKIERFNQITYTLIRLLILIDIGFRCRDDMMNLILYLTGFVIILVNDYFRIHYFYKNERLYYLSLMFSIVTSTIIIINLNSYVMIYMFMLLYELVIYNDSKIAKIFLAFETSLILFVVMQMFFSYAEFEKENVLDTIMILLYLIFYLISLFSFKALRKEKRKVELLNKEIESLTVAKERNRIATEIHDNLGHSLVALSMHLDVMENMLDKDVHKTAELLAKSREITKDSLTNLRKAVYALKDENDVSLIETLKRIISQMEIANKVKIYLQLEENLNTILNIHKHLISQTIKEALTNSIKHGKASEVKINFYRDNDLIYIVIKDNGKGCEQLVKGNGLLGIEKRIEGIKGKVNYQYNKGFILKIIIPA